MAKRSADFFKAGTGAPTGSMASMTVIKQREGAITLPGFYVWPGRKTSIKAPSTPCFVFIGDPRKTLSEKAPKVPCVGGPSTEEVEVYSLYSDGTLFINVAEYKDAASKKSAFRRLQPPFVVRPNMLLRLSLMGVPPSKRMQPVLCANFTLSIVESAKTASWGLFCNCTGLVPKVAPEQATMWLEDLIAHVMPHEQQRFPDLTRDDYPPPELAHPLDARPLIVYATQPCVRVQINNAVAPGRDVQGDAYANEAVVPDESDYLTLGETTQMLHRAAVCFYPKSADMLHWRRPQNHPPTDLGLCCLNLSFKLLDRQVTLDAEGNAVVYTIAMPSLLGYPEASAFGAHNFPPLAAAILAGNETLGYPPVPGQAIIEPNVAESRADPNNATSNAAERKAIGCDAVIRGSLKFFIPSLARYLLQLGVPVSPALANERFLGIQDTYSKDEIVPPRQLASYDDLVLKDATARAAALASTPDLVPVLASPTLTQNYGYVPLDGNENVARILKIVSAPNAAYVLRALPIDAAAPASLAVPFTEAGEDSRKPRLCALKTTAEGDEYIRKLQANNVQRRLAEMRSPEGRPFASAEEALQHNASWMQAAQEVDGGKLKIALPTVVFFVVPTEQKAVDYATFTQPSVLYEPEVAAPAAKRQRTDAAPAPAPEGAADQHDGAPDTDFND